MNQSAGVGTPDIAEEDRLPWLESADDDFREGPSPLRVLALVVIGMVLIAAAVWAYNHFAGRRVATGTGEMIEAPEGDSKVKPDQPGGMKVDGQGDTVFRTSEGAAASGSIDTRAVPEAPIAGKQAQPAPKAGPGAATVVSQIPGKGGRLTAQAPAMPPPRASAGGGGGSLVQLGSFPSESAANAAWATLSKRFAYVGALGKSVEKAEVGGNTVYRLRVNAGSADNASALCGKLKVAGEACFVPN